MVSACTMRAHFHSYSDLFFLTIVCQSPKSLLADPTTQEKKATAGSDWFNLPRTDVTPELKRELQILRMRDVLDPKRHYKKESSRAIIPEYSQVGTLIEGPTEFYSARIPNSQRKRSLVEEILEGERGSARFKTKYKEVQAKKMSGKRGHYRRLMEKRYRKKLKR